MVEVLILVYFCVTGLITHINHRQYQGKISILKHFLPAALFPLIFLNALLTLVLSFFGILWVLQIGYLMTEKDAKDLQIEFDDNDKNLH